MATSLEQVLTSPVELLAFTRRLLREGAQAHGTNANANAGQEDLPLFTLLFILECIVYLRSLGEVGKRLAMERRESQMKRRQLLVGLGLEMGENGQAGSSGASSSSSIGTSAEDDDDDGEPGRTDWARRGAGADRGTKAPMRRRHGVTASTMTMGSIADEDGSSSEDARPLDDAWMQYTRILYLLPSPDEAASDKAWVSPFRVTEASIPSLETLRTKAKSMAFGELNHGLIQQATAEALESLSKSSGVALSSDGAASDAVLARVIEAPYSQFATPLEPTLQAFILSALTSLQTAALSDKTPANKRASLLRPVATYRWILSALLEHYLGPEYGQTRLPGSEQRTSGNMRYAREDEDDEAIRNLFLALDETLEETDEEDAEKEKERVAALTILRRDDKLRWIFGESFSRVPTRSTNRYEQRGPRSTSDESGSQTSSRGSSERKIGPKLREFELNFMSRGGTGSKPPPFDPRKLPPAERPMLSPRSVATEPQIELTRMPTASSTSSTPAKGRPESLHSTDTLSTIQARGDSPVHRRIVSSSSSMTPLLQDRSFGDDDVERLSSSLHRHSMSSSRPLMAADAPFSNLATLPPLPAAYSSSVSRASSTRFSPSNGREVDHTRSLPSRLFSINDSPSEISSTSTPRMTSSPATSFVDQTAVPPTTNTLSGSERRDLVRKSKKLNKILGAPLDETEVARVLVDAVASPNMEEDGTVEIMEEIEEVESGNVSPTFSNSSSNFTSPGQISWMSPFTGFQQTRTMSSPASTSDTVSPGNGWTSPPVDLILTPDTPASTHAMFSPSIPAHSQSGSATAGARILDQQREERRRKMAKLQTLLGERVPAHLMSEAPGRLSLSDLSEPLPSVSMNRSGSRLGGLIKGKLGLGKKEPDAGAHTPPLRDSPTPDFAKKDIGQVGAVRGMAKTRKMEQVFGDLPPQTLYLSKQDAILHRRRHSELPSSATLGAFSQAFQRRPSFSGRSSRSIDSYRTSVASLKYLAEKDPNMLNDLVSVYTRSSQGGSVEDGAVDGDAARRHSEVDADKMSEAESPNEAVNFPVSATAAQLQRSPSQGSGSRRAVEKAQRLVKFFGTAKGPIWSILLDDLETALEEDEDVDEDERDEVLADVARLRKAQPVF